MAETTRKILIVDDEPSQRELLSGFVSSLGFRTISAATGEEALEINHEIEQWEARRDIEQLKHDRAYMAEKIEALEEEIQGRRQEIRTLKKEMTAAAKEIEKKKSFAGDSDGDESEGSAAEKSGK